MSLSCDNVRSAFYHFEKYLIVQSLFNSDCYLTRGNVLNRCVYNLSSSSQFVQKKPLFYPAGHWGNAFHKPKEKQLVVFFSLLIRKINGHFSPVYFLSLNEKLALVVKDGETGMQSPFTTAFKNFPGCRWFLGWRSVLCQVGSMCSAVFSASGGFRTQTSHGIGLGSNPSCVRKGIRCKTRTKSTMRLLWQPWKGS